MLEIIRLTRVAYNKVRHFIFMDNRNRAANHSIKISIQSRRSNLSSCRSLERPSWMQRQSSINKKHSLIQVMSLESNRKSDIYEKMLEEDKPLQKQSLGGLGISNGTYNYLSDEPFDFSNIAAQRKSLDDGPPSITHTCKCYTECQWDTCQCSLAKNQICSPGLCCQGCIDKKQQMLRGRLDQIEEQDKIFCTCKKTKCNKKYCSCFAAGIMCGHKCSCQGCINCPRKSEHMEVEQQEDPITEQQLAAMQLPEKMQFQPFTYGRISN